MYRRYARVTYVEAEPFHLLVMKMAIIKLNAVVAKYL